MGQVPTSFLVIGRGRVATHFSTYFERLGLKFRRSDAQNNLAAQIAQATHVLVLLSDQRTEAFLSDVPHELLEKKVWVHASGSLTTPFAWRAHPLFSFHSFEPLSMETYKAIPFVISRTGPAFSELLPGLPNPHYTLSDEEIVRYHALCVLGGNFSAMLWAKLMAEFESRYGIPSHAVIPYLRSVTEHLTTQDWRKPLGPLGRGDKETLERDRDALRGDSYAPVFQAILDAEGVKL